jgi:hypothetical protein
VSAVIALSSADAARVHLKDQWWAPKAFYERVRSAALATVPNLQVGLAFKAEHICGANFWVALSPGDARLAGRCIGHMVEMRDLPLSFASPKGSCLRYQRT